MKKCNWCKNIYFFKRQILNSGCKKKILLFIALMSIVNLASGCGMFENSTLGVDSVGKNEPEEDAFIAYYQALSEEDIVSEGEIYYADSQVLLTAISDVSYKEVESLISEYGGEVVGYISTTNDYQILFSEGKTYSELEEIVSIFKQESLIEDASISYVTELFSDTIDYFSDPWIDTNAPKDSSGSKWDEENPGGNNWWAEAIGMPSVWKLDFEYETVNIGIIDTMFDITNEDLDENLFVKLWNNPQDDDGNCVVSEIYKTALMNKDKTAEQNAYHGTHVAGIIAAQAENGFGIAGVCQNANLYGYSVKSDETSTTSESSWGDIFLFKCAIAQLLNEDVKVINISMGFDEALKRAQEGNSYYQSFVKTNSISLEKFLKKYIDTGKQFLIIKSAGNGEGYDASYDIFGAITDKVVKDRIMIVGAANYSESGYYYIADFSNIGSRVDVFAPGVNILSDIPTNLTTVKKGTSMATPIVSGIASLIWGINPNLNSEQVRGIILSSTYASMFNLDNRSSIVREWINLWVDPTPIVNAYICVQLAEDTAGKSFDNDLDVGTVAGMIYAQSKDGNFENLKINSVEVYGDDGEFIRNIDIEDIAYHVSTDNIEQTIILQSYSTLLGAGNYLIQVNVEGYEQQQQEVNIDANSVKLVDFSLEKIKEDNFVIENGKVELGRNLNMFLSTIYENGIQEYDFNNYDISSLMFFAYRLAEGTSYEDNVGNRLYIIPYDNVNDILCKYFGVTAPKEQINNILYENGEYYFPELDYGRIGMAVVIANDVEQIDDKYMVTFDIAYIWEENFETGKLNDNDNWDVYYDYSINEIGDNEFGEIIGYGNAILEQREENVVVISEFHSYNGYPAGLTQDQAYEKVEKYWESLGKIMPENVEYEGLTDYGHCFWGYNMTDTHANTQFRIGVDSNTGRLYDFVKDEYLD